MLLRFEKLCSHIIEDLDNVQAKNWNHWRVSFTTQTKDEMPLLQRFLFTTCNSKSWFENLGEFKRWRLLQKSRKMDFQTYHGMLLYVPNQKKNYKIILKNKNTALLLKISKSWLIRLFLQLQGNVMQCNEGFAGQNRKLEIHHYILCREAHQLLACKGKILKQNGKDCCFCPSTPC